MRVFLVLLTLLAGAVHYLYFSSPGWVVVNQNGDIHGLANKARATLHPIGTPSVKRQGRFPGTERTSAHVDIPMVPGTECA